jgi:hypothetical protein
MQCFARLRSHPLHAQAAPQVLLGVNIVPLIPKITWALLDAVDCRTPHAQAAPRACFRICFL